GIRAAAREGSVDGGDIDQEAEGVERKQRIAARRDRFGSAETVRGPGGARLAGGPETPGMGGDIGAEGPGMRRDVGGEMLCGSHGLTSLLRMTLSPARSFPPPEGAAALQAILLSF